MAAGINCLLNEIRTFAVLVYGCPRRSMIGFCKMRRYSNCYSDWQEGAAKPLYSTRNHCTVLDKALTIHSSLPITEIMMKQNYDKKNLTTLVGPPVPDTPRTSPLETSPPSQAPLFPPLNFFRPNISVDKDFEWVTQFLLLLLLFFFPSQEPLFPLLNLFRPNIRVDKGFRVSDTVSGFLFSFFLRGRGLTEWD